MENKTAKANAAAVSGWVLVAVIVLSGFALGQEPTLQHAVLTNQPHHVVLVSIPDRKLAVIENGAVIRTFDIAVGASVSPSPTGEFQIVNRLTDPTYYHSGTVIPPGDGNPVGPRWIGLNKKGYGIHGTNEPRSIGKARSHGCIRLNNRDIKVLFTLVTVGDTVEIRGERDEEIAQVFSNTNEGGDTTSTPTVTATANQEAPVQSASLTQVVSGQ